MSHLSDFEKSVAQAHKALFLMIERRCPATPQNYELWYNYATGHDLTLVADVDKAVDKAGVLAQAAADKIYDKNFAPPLDGKKLADLSGDVSEELGEVITSLETAKGQTNDYGDSLGSASKELNETTGETELKGIIERLLESTLAMQEHNKLLEKRLQSSQDHIAALNRNLESAMYESRNDRLTGIANRKAFEEAAKSMTAEAIEAEKDLCVLFGDIDHFKTFNDTYSHQTGDQVLRLVASCMTSVLKGQDFASRHGGEEFAILLPDTDLQAAVTVANHIRKTVQSKTLVKKSTGEDLGNITISFGVAKFRPGEGIDTWISRAGACLHAAKRAGRNLVKCETDPGVDLLTSAA